MVAVVDACFSGRTSSGVPLVEGLHPLVAVSDAPARNTASFLAAASDQVAGPLPGANRPAFSYLMLGALRGWADFNGDGDVAASEVHRYTQSVLQAVLRDRDQTPQLRVDADIVLARGVSERGPDIPKIVLGI